MLNFACGFVLASVIFVFYPPLAAIIAAGIKTAAAWIKEKFSAGAAPKE